jgi:2,5-diamino-6-(ribosylamino)-4(3H)-pyrimidinone 5'-phosphate reductase
MKTIAMRPYIICHMVSSVDGKIDGVALSSVMAEGDYEATGAKLKGDAWIFGRTTMQQHFAQRKPFVSASRKPAGPRPVFVARRAKSYAISVDTLGKLRWSGSDLDGDHLICVVSRSKRKAVALRPKSLERRKRDTLWLRYRVVRSKGARA